ARLRPRRLRLPRPRRPGAGGRVGRYARDRSLPRPRTAGRGAHRRYPRTYATRGCTLRHVGTRPRVHWEWSAHPFVAARRSWITELLEMAGGENAYWDLDVESVRISPEDAIA